MNEVIQLSPEEVDWCRNPITSDETAGVRLAMEVIVSAIEEYRMLVSLGQIVDGKVPLDCLIALDDHRIKQPWQKYNHERDVASLIEFFRSDQLERWLEYAKTKVTAAVIREKLRITL